MNDRFGKTQTVAANLINLVPSVISIHNIKSLERLSSFYSNDLPNVSLVPTEVWRWKTKWQTEDADKWPSTLQSALKECDKDFFPNLYVFRIACTILVTSCENERANSTFKNLITFLRSSMGQGRLCTGIDAYSL